MRQRGPDREAGAPPGLRIRSELSASTDPPSILARLSPALRARLVGIVARPCRHGAGSLGVADEDTEAVFDRVWRVSYAAGYEVGRAGEQLACASDQAQGLAVADGACRDLAFRPASQSVVVEAAGYALDAFEAGRRAGEAARIAGTA